MLNLQTLKILPFTEFLSKSYESTFGNLHPEYINFLKMASSISLENIANGDMLYHDVDHTIMVTSVGQEIIRGKHLFEGGFSAEDGLNYLLALLCHDVGFVKGACKKDDLKKDYLMMGKEAWLISPIRGLVLYSNHIMFQEVSSLFMSDLIILPL